MRRALALTAILAALLGTVPAQEEAPGLLLEQRVFEIGRKLRCPVCTSESVADSAAELAVQMRASIQTQLEQGRDEAEILAYFQERYGDWILQNPPKRGPHLLVWLLPAGAALLGLASLVVFVRRWRRAAEVPVEVDEADLERVRAALDRG